MTLKQSTEKLLQGCGIVLKLPHKKNNTYENNKHDLRCGEVTARKILCPVCKAIAKERLEMCKHFREFLNGHFYLPKCDWFEKELEELNTIITKLESALE